MSTKACVVRGFLAALSLVAPLAGAAVDTATLTKADASSVTLTATNKSYNRVTKESLYDVSGTRVGTGSLRGPVYLVLEALGPAGVTAKNAAGTTQSGAPYYVVSAGDLAAGAKLQQSIVLGNPNNARVTFTPSIYFTPASTPPPPSPLSLIINSPSTLITVGSTPIEVRGTVSNVTGPLTLTVNGAPVTASGGTFTASVALQEGHNAIVARAVTGSSEATATISVSLDLTPPYITVESPADGATVITKFITVTGLINDIVRGTVSDGQANVTVNGTAAAVANRTYAASNIELVEGLNTLTIRGADQVGNTSTVTRTVTYKVPTTKHVELFSGQGQRARIRGTLPQPLVVKLLDDLGAPVANKPVVFRVTEGDGQVGFGTIDQAAAVLKTTDANGLASTTMMLGSRAGNGNNRVEAMAVGFQGTAAFFASADPNPADKVSVHSGNNQRGGLKQPLPLPFVVNVTDDGANVIAGAQIAFTVTAGGGKFQNGATSYTATTDSDGRASATLTLGDEAGLDTQRVTATLGVTGLYAGFTASALTSGDPGQTAISGVVLDNQDQPLPSVTVRVEGTTREAKSNAQGQFKITEVPVGPVHLIVDGSTTTVPGEWPTLPYNLVTVPGADNPLAGPIYMVKLDTEHAVWVGKEDKLITHPDMPGFALTVAKNSVTFPNGAREGYVSVTSVNASKIPMAPPNGMQPQLIVTIQPTGARFDPPAALQLPNVDGHAPGAQVEMYSFDHDLEEFVAIGLGTVSLDGTVIRSNPGVGVVKAGWHCGSQPTGGGCAASPGECQKCDGNCNIVADNSQTPKSIANTKDDCKKPVCVNGAPTQVVDASDFNGQCAQGCDASGNPQQKANGTTCDDGLFCTSGDGFTASSDKCSSGKCEGKKIDTASTYVSGGVSYDFTKLREIMNGAQLAGKFVPGCSTSGLAISGALSLDVGKECCESKSSMVNSTKFNGSVTASIGKAQCSLPLWSWGLATLHGDIGVEASGTFTATGIKAECTDTCGWEVGGSLDVTLTGAIGVAVVSADVLDVRGGIAGKGSLSLKESCTGAELKGCVGPPSAFGEVTVGGWYSKKIETPPEWTRDLVACYP